MATKSKPGSAAERKHAAPGKPITDWATVIPSICAQIAEGKSLRAIVREGGGPSMFSIMDRLARDQDFREAYEFARAIQADSMFEEILEIADDGTNDWMEWHGKNDTGWRLNGEHVQRSRLRVDSRKWILAKMLPKKYGDLAPNSDGGQNEQAKALRELRELMLKGKPDVDPPEDS